ncbi:MAG: D-2-hydroxyacid dehydrogenase [Victivallaceae bacterium]
MNIVILDGYTSNPGDIQWPELESIGHCRIYDSTPESEVVQRCGDAEIVLTNKTMLDAGILKQLPKLRYIGVLATGYNVVDVQAATAHGITVTNVPAYSTDSVAQAVFAHILNLTHNVAGHAASVAAGEWERSEHFCYWKTPLIELRGLTLGILGFGRIGAAVAEIGRAFGMKVIVFTRTSDKAAGHAVELVDIAELFRRSDFLTLHCPLSSETAGIVSSAHLYMMKPSAFLINTARGGLVDEAALAEALNSGRLAGAGLDVLSVEPPSNSNPLLKARNCHITPHFAWASKAARQRLLNIAAANVRDFLNGVPSNAVK